jgi:uncharacterized Zn finger protein
MLGRIPEKWMAHSLRIEVAKAAKTQYPQESIRLYIEVAMHIMDRRDRGNYSQAAQYLRACLTNRCYDADYETETLP